MRSHTALSRSTDATVLLGPVSHLLPCHSQKVRSFALVGIRSVATVAASDDSGRMSRGGYYYQDLCALRYCINIAHTGIWEEVWCESHDDIVLYRKDETAEEYRFIQVKYRYDATQHWSFALLCSCLRSETIRDSIIGKIFSKDVYAGKCDFRLVTNEGVMSELRPFLYHWGWLEPSIDITCPEAERLIELLASRGWSSPNAKPTANFVERFAVEQHSATADDLEAVIIRELDRVLRPAVDGLLQDELETVFQILYAIVFRAATISVNRPGNPERILRSQFRNAAISQATIVSQRISDAADTEPATTIRAELESVGAYSLVDSAIELRQSFYRDWRRSAGSARGEALNSALMDIQAICSAATLASLIDPSQAGTALLMTILNQVETQYQQLDWQASGLSLGTVNGMVYFQIGRGRLRLM